MAMGIKQNWALHFGVDRGSQVGRFVGRESAGAGRGPDCFQAVHRQHSIHEVVVVMRQFGIAGLALFASLPGVPKQLTLWIAPTETPGLGPKPTVVAGMGANRWCPHSES